MTKRTKFPAFEKLREIKVTRKNIASGEQESITSCPIARAVRRQLGSDRLNMEVEVENAILNVRFSVDIPSVYYDSDFRWLAKEFTELAEIVEAAEKGGLEVDVDISGGELRVEYSAELPEVARQFINDFDNNRPVKPFAFNIL